MVEAVCTIPVPQTVQELELAIRRYKTSDISGAELFCQWQAIRDAALALRAKESWDDSVAGEESY
ncbi:MAG: hypothetical protein KME15_15105 [Drouetiella hepatica Uher 2000/2452]|jgi:hypothetical protein|uniref:Uncharacterized protein n=1 Tax=Drouetiella hepatica Uher 2000/2452 TaxID=904376 RepID=A0A951QDQ4_9CYAN|nr:hypothetical protein [Drouetiella hepatica Uher 2000/2452]